MSSNIIASPSPQSPPPRWDLPPPSWVVDEHGNLHSPKGKAKSHAVAPQGDGRDEKEPFPVIPAPATVAAAAAVKSAPVQDKKPQAATPSKKPYVKPAPPKPQKGYDEEKKAYWQQQKALDQAKAASSIGPAQPQGGILALQESLCGDCECCECCEGFGELLFYYGYYYIFNPLVDGMYKILSYLNFYPTNDAQRRAAGWFIYWFENTPNLTQQEIFEAFKALPPRALAAAKRAVETRSVGGLEPYKNRQEQKGAPAALTPQALNNLAFWNYVRANSVDLIIRDALEQFSITGRLHNDPLPVAEQRRLAVAAFLRWRNEADRSQEESIERFRLLPQPALVAAKKAVEKKHKSELDRFFNREKQKDPDTSDSALRQRAFSEYVRENGVNFVIREALDDYAG